MTSYKEIYTEEVDKLFGHVERSPFKGTSQDAVPQEGEIAPLVPFSFNGADVFDSTDTMDVLVYIPDEMVKVVKARAVLSFREFFAPATTVASGGGSTSGSGGGSTPTSSTSNAHRHRMWTASGLPSPGLGVARVKAMTDAAGSSEIRFDLADGSAGDTYTYDASGAHDHSVTIGPHTHTTPAHSHDLSYGIFKESMPTSWSVELRLYQWDGSAWDLVHSITSGLTSQLEDVDLSDHITAPGKYRISLMSAAAQPQGGRLGCDVAGHVVGAIQAPKA